MNNEKLRFWFVDSERPRHEDFKHKLEFADAAELRLGLEKKRGSKYFRAYLGNYEIGTIAQWWNNNFVIDNTKKFGNNIFSVVGRTFDEFVYIESNYMDYVIKNGVTLEDFVVAILQESNNIDVVITDNHHTSFALSRAGYISVLSLKDFIHVDFRDKINDESVLFVKSSTFDSDSVTISDYRWYSENKTWFEANKHSKDWKDREILESSAQVLELITKRAKYDEGFYKLYFGEYEIGVLSLPVKTKHLVINIPQNKKYFELLGSPEDELSDSIATRLEQHFGMRVAIPFDTMDSIIGKKLKIDSFLSIILGKELDPVVTDDSQYIWDLLHNGYKVVCSLNDILHHEIKCVPNYLLRTVYNDDRRVILVKINSHD